MNFSPLFLTARVLKASYQVISTAILLYYLSQRIAEGRKPVRTDRRFNRYD